MESIKLVLKLKELALCPKLLLLWDLSSDLQKSTDLVTHVIQTASIIAKCFRRNARIHLMSTAQQGSDQTKHLAPHRHSSFTQRLRAASRKEHRPVFSDMLQNSFQKSSFRDL